MLAEVTTTFRRVSNELVSLLIENGELLTGTPEHPFWVVEGDALSDRPKPTHGSDEDWSGITGRWVNLGDLRAGDIIRTRLGDQSRVIKTENRPAIELVYNFEVAGLQNYAIGECGVLTHNYPPPDNIPTKVEVPPAKVGGEAPKIKDATPPAKTHALNEKQVVKGGEAPPSGTVEPVVAHKGKLPTGLRDYLRDVETQTGVSLSEKQIDKLKDALRKKGFKRVTPEQVARNRREFDNLKDNLIAEWERQTGQSWPRYAENVPKKNGKPGFSRLKGDPYDAHHLIENELGGPAEWWNIHPARFPDQHQGGIHRTGSTLRKLLENID